MKSIIEDDMERKFVYFIIKGITSLRHFEIHTNCVHDNCDVISDMGMAVGRQLKFGWQ